MTNNNKLIYIAGPYTAKNKEAVKQNIKKAEDLAKEVLLLGAIPIIPHKITSFFDLDCRFSNWHSDDWLNNFCFPLLQRCDALLLVDGWENSCGAKAERRYALINKIPVYQSISEIRKNYVNKKDIKIKTPYRL